MVLKAVLLIIASQNFRDEELFDTQKAIESQKIQTIIASSSTKESRGMLGRKAKPEILTSDVKTENYSAIVFIGGSGAEEFWDDKTAHKIINEAVAQDKVVAAICIAPVTLARAGILKGKNFTAWNSEVENIKSSGANYIKEPVVIDGKIITANGPNAAKQFGKEIAGLLKKGKQ